MLDILAIPLYYIGFNKNVEVEYYYQDFGFKDVNHFQAIDGRKMNPLQLLDDGKITIRCYNDVVGGRHQHTGMSSMGGVGCTMSHCALWQLCIDQNLPYITIAEEDNRMTRMEEEDIQKISEYIQKPNGIFISTHIGKTPDSNPLWSDKSSFAVHFMGLNFYIVSQEACKVLVKYCYPIDVQTDWYIANLASRGKVKVNGYAISYQVGHPSSIQDVCIKCFVPNKPSHYRYPIIFLLVILLLSIIGIILSAYYHRKWKTCTSL